MYSETQLQELKKAYSSGMTRVRLSSGDEITYRSLAEMERVITQMEKALSNKKTRRRFGYAMQVNKGL
jgi:precorrin-4 methylase